ncbi:hypothetical protein [Azonexus hydrophilus]|uniref:Uncharacterized protein n=1 Tax=Azonexus hydrophilus TaxID=418702 RepID=A0ABZ2XME6_9RHOO
MRSSVLLGAALFLLSTAAHPFSLNPFTWLVPKDTGNYASKVAASIKDTPACQKFKAEILSHNKGNPLKAKDNIPIIEAKRRANEAGCAK